MDALRASIPAGEKLAIEAFASFVNDAIGDADNYFNFDEASEQVNQVYKSMIVYSDIL